MKFYPEKEFNRNICTGCGTCARVCPSYAIIMRDGYPVFSNSRCIGCGHCGVFCPENAFGMEPLPVNPPTPQQYRALLETRRSIRIYSNKVPSEEEISKLISIVSQSPTGTNSQGITLRVIRGSESVNKLVEPVRKILRILSFTGLTHILGKITGMSEYFKSFLGGEDVIFKGAPVVLFFHVPRKNVTSRTDGVIAASAVMNHAAAMGMGTLWNGVAEKLYPLVRSWHTPELRGTKLTAVLCIGYPALRQKWKAPARNYNILD